MLDWLVVGGGIQGTHLALTLMEGVGIDPASIRILDPHPLLCERWRQLAINTGMSYLRSPMVHHLGPREFPLDRYVRTDEGRPYRKFIPPYNRPSTRLFNAHALAIIKRYRIESLHLPTRVSGLRREGEGWAVHTPQGDMAARNVLLAFGHTEQPFWPDWAHRLRTEGRPVFHIFDDRFRRNEMKPVKRVAVLGGGLSGVTLALTLASAGNAEVTLASKTPVRVEQFDSDPGWLGPKFLTAFSLEKDYARRRAIITEARMRGTVPPDVARDLNAAKKSGAIRHVVGEATPVGDSGAEGVAFNVGGEKIEVDRLILATGFQSRRPGSPWLDKTVSECGLPVAPCGYPILGEDLSWAPGLYAAGALAELELGPAARNISGARNAADRFMRLRASAKTA